MQCTAKVSTNQGKTKQISQQTNKQKTWTGTSQKKQYTNAQRKNTQAHH